MRVTAIPARVAPWTDLSRQALRAAHDPQRKAEALALLQQIAGRWPDHLSDIALTWVDTMATALGVTEYGPGFRVYTGIDFYTYEQLVDPRELTPYEEWVFEVIRARMTWDLKAWGRAFVQARTDGTLGRSLSCLLWVVGYNLARVEEGR